MLLATWGKQQFQQMKPMTSWYVCFKKSQDERNPFKQNSLNPGTVGSELPCLTVTPKIKGPTLYSDARCNLLVLE